MSPEETIPAALLALLACPACDDRPPLDYNDEQAVLTCTKCRRTYELSPDGIPLLLVENDADRDDAASQ